MRHARFDPREVELERRVIGEERARELELAARPARPEPPGRRLPAPPVPQPDPRLARGRRADRRRRPRARSTAGTTGPTARCWSSSATWTRTGRWTGSRRSSADIPPGRRPAPGRRPPSRASRAGATSRWSSPTAWRGACWAGAPCRAATPTSPRSTSSPTSSPAAGGRGSGSALVETTGLATWVEAAHATAQRGGQLLIQLEADPAASRAAIERCIRDELRRLADAGPTPDELARSRCRLEAAWRWERDDLAALASGLGHAALWGDWRTWPAEHRAATGRRRPATSAAWPPRTWARRA